jgi:hypothetical protein
MHHIIHEASITGLFRLILIVLTVYVVYSLFIRYIFPALLRKYVSDFQNRFTAQNQHRQEDQTIKKEGEISIKYVNKDKNGTSIPPNDGDYVDFEEIK